MSRIGVTVNKKKYESIEMAVRGNNLSFSEYRYSRVKYELTHGQMFEYLLGIDRNLLSLDRYSCMVKDGEIIGDSFYKQGIDIESLRTECEEIDAKVYKRHDVECFNKGYKSRKELFREYGLRYSDYQLKRFECRCLSVEDYVLYNTVYKKSNKNELWLSWSEFRAYIILGDRLNMTLKEYAKELRSQGRNK